MFSRFYWYRSGVTDTMRKALTSIVRAIEGRIPLANGDVILDIGSNDGTLLRAYRNPELITIGVEPATNLVEEGRVGISFLINDFWSVNSYTPVTSQKAKVVTAIGMFYDLEDPLKFVQDVATVLHPEGIFVSQLMCLQNMLDMKDVGNLAHEHLEFYSLQSLEYMFDQCGLELFDIETVDVNGLSYRLWVKHRNGPIINPPGCGRRISAIRQKEGNNLTAPRTYENFFLEMQDNKETVVEFIKLAKSKGKSIWVYGASTKGNVILQYFGLDASLIDGCSERSPEKFGKYTVGTNIPIYSEDEARKAKPDYFLVLPYTFINEFLLREHAWHEAGGRFILPLPSFKII
jgi:SAM-dependent methyltransferase